MLFSRKKTILYEIITTITKLIAPILIHNAEDITNHFQSKKNKSIHKEEFNKFNILESVKNFNSLINAKVLSKEIIQEQIKEFSAEENLLEHILHLKLHLLLTRI